jgi:hypothetical protein
MNLFCDPHISYDNRKHAASLKFLSTGSDRSAAAIVLAFESAAALDD